MKEGLATGEPQNIAPVRLALTEAAWLAEDLGACHEQLAALSAMRLDNFDPWELGELATWCRRSGMKMPPSLPLRGRLRRRRPNCAAIP